MKHLTGLLLLCCYSLAQAAPDYDSLPYRYLPLSMTEMGKPFPLKWIRELDQNRADLPQKLNVSIGLSGAQLSWRNEQDERPGQPLTATGKDNAGKPWRVQIGWLRSCAPTQLYQADLDNNGIQDLVLITETCGNGLAPSTEIHLLTFESNGRPILLTLDSYFSEEKHTIPALVDMNHDGRAELIDMRYGGGYWAANVYQVEQARWQRVQGEFAQRSYPLYTRFTQRGNRVAVTPPTAAARAIIDFSNTTSLMTGKLLSMAASRQEYHENDVVITIKDSKNQVCTLTENWAITLDRASGRTILAALNTPFPSDPMLTTLPMQGKLTVNIYGQLDTEKCSPTGVWLSE